MSGGRRFGWCLGVVAFFALILGGMATPTVAVAGPWTPQRGAQGWCTVTGGSGVTCTGSPWQACKIQQERFAPDSKLTAVYPTNVPYLKDCFWVPAFGDSGPSTVQFNCDGGYAVNPGGFCTEIGYDLQGRKGGCGTSYPSTANPISLMTGVKTFRADDFTSADGGLS